MTRKEIIEYRGRGGLRNIYRTVSVYNNGDVLKVVTTKFKSATKSNLDKTQLEDLLKTFEDNGFFGMNDFIAAKIPIITNAMSYAISYDYNGKYKIINIDYGAILPVGLGEIIRQLQKL